MSTDDAAADGRPVLVTGARGFAGSALVRSLRRDGQRVRAMVRPRGDEAELRRLGAEVVHGDVRDPAAADAAVAGCGRVYNFASPFRSAGAGDEVNRQTHVDGLRHLVAAAWKHGVSRFVQCSTVGVHGNVRQPPCHEDSPIRPGDAYQRTKLEGERLFRDAVADGLPGVLMRPGPMYGPGDLRMLKLFRLVHTGRWVTLGDGSAWFHPSYIDDLVEGFRLCGEHPDAVGGTFILAGPEPCRLHALIAEVAAAVRVAAPTRRLPVRPMMAAAWVCETACRPLGIEPPLHRRRVKFFTNNRYFSSARAERTLGYRPRVGVAEGVRRTAGWYFDRGLLRGPRPPQGASAPA
ncbi:MAG: NAD-dependent epimerase/dehydratase family protein [Planctomycetota bacterium]